jgi:hypothetical protein
MDESTRPEQLSFLPDPGVPVQQRLDARTRQVGLAGVAHARRTLDAARRERQAREELAAAERAAAHRPARVPVVPEVRPPRAA